MPGSPYLMLGAIEPRKNHHQVLDAFESLWERPSTGHVRLAIVGRPGFKPEGVIRRIKSDPRFGSRLLLLADLDDAEVDHAYRNARGLVLASIAEGFGLPIVEALRHGQTVIASDLAIHREVGGDACTYFNLSDTCALADAIMEHEREVGDAAAPLRKRVSPATWGEAAARLMDSIGNALGRGTLSDDSARRSTT
jgi:glycosyltransferase involved in cell wall biosynthesis